MVQVEDRDAVRWITFDKPEVLNALDGAATQATYDALEEVRGRDDIRVVVLTGTDAAFSAGAQMASLQAALEHPVETMDGASRLIRSVATLDKPVIAAVNGVAAGVACGAALAADLVVAATSASFLLPFARLGLMPDGGSTLSVAASIGRARAMRMALLAEPMGAEEAYAAGLVSHLVPDADLLGVVDELAARLAAGPAIALEATKRAVNAATLGDLEDALAREHAGQRALFTTADFAEGLAAFVGKRRPDFHGR